MKILISIEHPAWAHQFRNMISELRANGHSIKVVAINKDRDIELLNIFNIKYDIISTTSGNNSLEKALIFLKTIIRIFRISLAFKPDIYIGRASPMIAINSFLFRKPHILFEDTEHASFSLYLCKLFSCVILTPSCFKRDLGKKQIKINTYKELFYLSPNRFNPNSLILKEIGVLPDDVFIIVRFVAFNAHHDIGQHGIIDKLNLINVLENYGKVFISSEAQLPPNLEKYKLNISPEKIHDVLFYATLCISEGATVASESSILGTHAFYVNTTKLGCLEEKEQRYGLVYNFSNSCTIDQEAILKAEELLNINNLRILGKKKRKNLLKDQIDPASIMIWLIENYPESYMSLKANSNLQNSFKIIDTTSN